MTTRLYRLLVVVLALAALAHPLGAMTQRDRSSYLDWMVKSLPSAPQFEQWQQPTCELPPDFDALPRNNFLPDPLTFMNGGAVRNASDWTRRRAEIRQLLLYAAALDPRIKSASPSAVSRRCALTPQAAAQAAWHGTGRNARCCRVCTSRWTIHA